MQRDFTLNDWPDSGEVIVYDLEYTAWEGSLARGWSEPWEHREVVQIGAVRIRADGGMEEVAALDVLSKPKRNPVLSDYFTALTGITNTVLARDGQSFADAYAAYGTFSQGAVLHLCNGTDGDLLAENCAWREIEFDQDITKYLNLRPALAAALDVPGPVAQSCDLPELFGLAPVMGAHTGLGDARAIAKALREMRRRDLF